MPRRQPEDELTADLLNHERKAIENTVQSVLVVHRGSFYTVTMNTDLASAEPLLLGEIQG